MWWPTTRQPIFCLFQPRPPSFSLAEFQRGIDNVRSDVFLSPQFCRLAGDLITSLLGEQAPVLRKQTHMAGTVRKELEGFREAYASLLEAAIHQSRLKEQHALVSLMQLAVLKYLSELVDRQIQHYLLNLKVSLTATRPEQVERSTLLHDRVVWLTKNHGRVRYSIARLIFQQVYKVEKGGLGDLQAALFGGQRPVPANLFINPLVQAGSHINDEVLLKHYVLIGNRVDDRNSLSALRGLLRRTFYGMRLEGCRPCPLQRAGTEGLQLLATSERNDDGREVPGWWEVPENLDLLLNPEPYTAHLQKLKQLRSATTREQQGQVRQHLRYQAWQRQRLEKLLRETQLKHDVLATYELRALYGEYSEWVNAQLLYQYLVGGRHTRQTMQKIRMLVRENDPTELIRRLEEAGKRVRRQARRTATERVVRYFRDLATYQRDLKQYQVVQDAMKGIRLLSEPNELRLSRDNNRLYEFVTLDEEPGVRQVIRTHTVIKADVRGSTRVTAELLRQGLNPASHFDTNFFAPIRELLEPFGADKVFIEGDAVILAIFEHEGDPGNWFSAARSCGLAQSMLKVVALHNHRNRAHRLPQLELGVGVAYCPESPTFLYDDAQPIMISSAIAQADRLSSCAWGLRTRFPGGGVPRNPVAVFEVDDDALSEPQFGGKGERFARYNVNGIALDEAAFEKLRSEIDLKRVAVDVYGSGQPAVFYLGRYPQTNGVLRRLAVREGLVRALHEPERETGRYYYEVVTNPKLLELLDEYL